MPFTDKQVNAFRPRDRRYEVPEPGRTGLGMRVTPNGTKTWTFRYRLNRAQRRMVLDTYPTLSLVDARLKLAEAKKVLETGQDPGAPVAAARAAERAAPTVEEMASAYLHHATETMEPATVKEDRRIIAVELLKPWRGRLARDITRRDVMTLLNAVQRRRVYVMRNRIAGVITRLFMFGLDEGLIDTTPAIKLRRLQRIHGRKVEQSRTRFLSKEEIRAFWHNLDTVPITSSIRTALKWALLTGQRRAEVAGTPRHEIDDTAELWTIPSERTKNKKEQLLPLPPLVLRLLAEADAARIRRPPTRLHRKDRVPYDPTPSPWLFPSARHGKPITPGALTCAIDRHRHALGIGDATVHDLRRTMATWLGEMGTDKGLVSALLNHAPKGVTDIHYNKASLLGPKRHAMNIWAAWLERVIAGETVPENVMPFVRKTGLPSPHIRM
ncbi:MAG: tyrosine-type recombinase/integrase [Nitrospira sp.]|nr:tyrosine-type recombinase/integrase [Nitrospira sp.]